MNWKQSPLATTLAFTAVVEVATGLVLLVDPALVALLLLGGEPAGLGLVLGRCFGIALLSLGLACWPGRQLAETASAARRGMLTYNALVALFLAYLATAQGMHGALSWPAVALHAAMALLLLRFGPAAARHVRP